MVGWACLPAYCWVIAHPDTSNYTKPRQALIVLVLHKVVISSNSMSSLVDAWLGLISAADSPTCQLAVCTTARCRPCAPPPSMTRAGVERRRAWTLCCLLPCPMGRCGALRDPATQSASRLLLLCWETPLLAPWPLVLAQTCFQ
jgi:hypothetical protein